MPIFPRYSGSGDVVYLSQIIRFIGVGLCAFCFIEFLIPGAISRSAAEKAKLSFPVLAGLMILGILLFSAGQVLKNKGH